MDYTYRERHGEALYRFRDGMLPSDFFRRNVVLSFQEDAIGIRLRDVIGVDNMMWGSDYPHSESTLPSIQDFTGQHPAFNRPIILQIPTARNPLSQNFGASTHHAGGGSGIGSSRPRMKT
jgi:hypothetical protein